MFRSIFLNSLSVYHDLATSSDVIFFACSATRTLIWFWKVTRFFSNAGDDVIDASDEVVEDDIDDTSFVKDARLIEDDAKEEDEDTVDVDEVELVQDNRFMFCRADKSFPFLKRPAPKILISCFLI